MLVDILTILGGLALLTFAADRLVLAAARLARVWGLSPILIGAVVVGLGTSLPEMLVSGIAAGRADGLDLAVGNIVGSNVANLALVLGLSVTLNPIAGQLVVLRREGVVMALASLVFAAFAFDGNLDRVEGVLLAIGLAVAMAAMIRWSQSGGASERVASEVDEMIDDAEPVGVGREIAFGLGSLVTTLIGARLLVVGAESIARTLGVSEAVIGLTLVAIGTSLPELATALAAARRRENDLVLGNVLGSNLFNALGVGGVAGIIGNGSMLADFRPSLVVMLAVTGLAGFLAATKDRLERWEGVVLLALFPVTLFLLS